MENVSFNFAGKRALVTGAGRGIGRAIAIALSKAGAETFALSKTKENLDSLAKEHPAIRLVCVDLTDWDETKKAVEQLGQIDLLVNNAAYLNHQLFLDVDKDTFTKTITTNVEAVINVSQVVAKTLIKNKKPGAIVNVSSITSMRAFSTVTTYGTSKGALDSLTRNMVLDLAPQQIRVNSVHPTLVRDTDIAQCYVDNEEISRLFKARTPQRRFAEISEIVGPVLFLLSDAASMVNGAFLTVDGGYTVM